MTSLYFEDFRIGDEFKSPERIITETDIMDFARLTWVFNPIHTDEKFAHKSIFKKRIAHGPLILSFSFGLIEQLGHLEDSFIAFLGMEFWMIFKPVFIDDTINVVDTCVAVKETKAKKAVKTVSKKKTAGKDKKEKTSKSKLAEKKAGSSRRKTGSTGASKADSPVKKVFRRKSV